MMTGVYVHIPFCLKRCDYCDFNTFVDRDEDIPAYIAALNAHIRRAGESADSGRAGRQFTSVFVGGGTPTYLSPADLVSVIDAVSSSFSFTPDAEWSVEANPETVTSEMAQALSGSGINRISLGAQSFDSRVLATLGRWHDPQSVQTAVMRLREAGITRLSLDLIYGTPGETDESWRQSLGRVIEMGVTHVSAYALTVEPNTPYATRVRSKPSLEPDEDVQARRMEIADDVLGAAGLHRYEVSNWATPGDQSAHNLTYWRGGEWLGFGSGAHGAWEGRRYWLVRDPAKYARMVAEGAEPLGGDEWPDPGQVRLERLMMGLRLVEGVSRAELEPLDQAAVSLLESRGLLMVDDERVALTQTGMPIADRVIRHLA